MTLLSRRSLITGLAGFVAAPAIVRVGSIMPVKAISLVEYLGGEINGLTADRIDIADLIRARAILDNHDVPDDVPDEPHYVYAPHYLYDPQLGFVRADPRLATRPTSS